jgi:large subunit ribosomal protein L11
MKIKLLTEGGNMAPNPALSQKLGPAGLNVNQVIQQVNSATSGFKGLKVPVELDIDTSKRTFDVKVFSPPASELLKKETGLEKGSGMQKKIKVANLSIEQVISVAKSKYPNMLSKNFKSAVKSIVGTCGPLGFLIENKGPNEIQLDIDSGKYDSEIDAEETKTPEDKRKKLDEFFAEVKAKQDMALKQEQAAKEAEAAAAAAAAGTAPATAAGAAPETGAEPTPAVQEGKEGKKAKAEEKKPGKK